jgi:hypothetical protein
MGTTNPHQRWPAGLKPEGSQSSSKARECIAMLKLICYYLGYLLVLGCA